MRTLDRLGNAALLLAAVLAAIPFVQVGMAPAPPLPSDSEQGLIYAAVLAAIASREDVAVVFPEPWVGYTVGGGEAEDYVEHARLADLQGPGELPTELKEALGLGGRRNELGTLTSLEGEVALPAGLRYAAASETPDVSLSRIGFDRARQRAVVLAVVNRSGSRSGEGRLFFLDRGPGGRWRILGEAHQWYS